MKKVIEKYEWLSNLPDSFLNELECDEFYLPNNELSISISQIEEKLNTNVMVYKADSFRQHCSNKKQLCQSLKMKELSKSDIELIKNIEKQSLDLISIVLYEKPAQFKI